MLNPYVLEPFQNGLKFSSENGSTYYAYFSDLSETFNESIVDFSFERIVDPPKGARKVYDPRISHTLCKIIDSFLSSHSNTVVSYTPLQDIKASSATRALVFGRWYSDLQKHICCPNVETDRLTITSKNGALIVCIFYQREIKNRANNFLNGKLPELVQTVFEQKD